MDEQKIKNLVKNWYERAKNERNKFSKFVFLWFCLNAWLAYRTGKEFDRQMLNVLKRKDPVTLDITNEYDRAFCSEPFRQRIQNLQNLCPIDDSRGKQAPVIIDNATNFSQVCEAIYRIRCNLFHGGKTPNENRDLKLVIVAGNILEKWIGNLISRW